MATSSPIIRELILLREEAHLSTIDLAGRARLDPNTLSAWEAGAFSPPLRFLERWAAALNYELDLHQKEPSP